MNKNTKKTNNDANDDGIGNNDQKIQRTKIDADSVHRKSKKWFHLIRSQTYSASFDVTNKLLSELYKLRKQSKQVKHRDYDLILSINSKNKQYLDAAEHQFACYIALHRLLFVFEHELRSNGNSKKVLSKLRQQAKAQFEDSHDSLPLL